MYQIRFTSVLTVTARGRARNCADEVPNISKLIPFIKYSPFYLNLFLLATNSMRSSCFYKN